MIYGNTEPRIWTPPLQELTNKTSLGFAFCDFCEVIGVELLPWQKWLAIHALEIIADGDMWRFRFRYVVILVARQNGKTFFEVLLNIFFLFGLKSHLVLGTAQNLDTAVETFEDTVAQVESVPELKEFLKKVNRGTGKREMLLDTGDRYKVIAATRKARGLSSDLIMMDELREQNTWEAWGAISKTMMARPSAILFGLSNAGDVTSVVLRHLRMQAHEQLGDPDAISAGDKKLGGEEVTESLGLFEWSANPECSIYDRTAWAAANPSLGYGFLTEQSLASAAATDPEQIFRTECLCQWVESLLPEPFPAGAWNAALDNSSQIAPESELYFGIDLSQNRRWTCIAVAGLREDGNMHIEVVARQIGTEWAVNWFKERQDKQKMNLAFQGRGCPVVGLAEQICTMPNINRMPIEGPELMAGWGRFWDSVAANDPSSNRGGMKTFHLAQPILDAPAKTMQLRNLGGGVQLPDRVKSPDDASPMIACFVAFSAATMMIKEPTKKIYESSYARGGSLMFA